MNIKICQICHKSLIKDQQKYCSNKCQSLARYTKYVEGWKNGFNNGSRGVSAKNISNYIRRYLFDKFGEKCGLCGWSLRNPITNMVPLEIDHIDGHSENNDENNLRLICPNCHALSSNYRNLNNGNGRAWRKAKYLKNSDLLK